MSRATMSRLALSTTGLLALGSVGVARAQPVNLGVQGQTHDLVCDATGTLHVIWAEPGSLSYGTIVGTAIVGAEEHVAGSDNVTTRGARPRLAVNADGSEIHTAWVYGGLESALLVHGWRDGTGWHSENVWEQPTLTDHMAYPAVAVDGDGAVHIIAQHWVESDGPSTVEHFVKPLGGDWSAGEVLQPDDGPEWVDQVLVGDVAGGVHAAWKAGNRAGRYRHAPLGDDFASMVEIPKADYVNTVSFGDLFVDGELNVHHAFVGISSTAQSIEYSFKPPAGEFSASTTVSDVPASGVGDKLFPAIGVDAQGVVHVAWAENGPVSTEPDDTIRYARSDGASWSRQDLATDGALYDLGKVSLAVTPDAVNVVWRGPDADLMLYAIPNEVAGGAGGSGGGGGAGATGGSSAGGGPAGGMGGDAGAGGTAGNPATPGEDDDGGCGCRAAGRATPAPWVGAVVLGLVRRCRRRSAAG